MLSAFRSFINVCEFFSFESLLVMIYSFSVFGVKVIIFLNVLGVLKRRYLTTKKQIILPLRVEQIKIGFICLDLITR